MIDQEALQESQKIMENNLSSLRDSMRKIEEEYDKSITSLPSNLELTGMAICEGLQTAVTSVLSFMSQTKRKITKSHKTKADKKLEEEEEIDTTTKELFQISILLSNALNGLSVYLENDTINKSSLGDSESYKTVMEIAKRRQKDVASKPESELCHNLLKICERVISVCEELKQIQANLEICDSELPDLAKKIRQVQEDANKIASEGKKKVGNVSGFTSPVLSVVSSIVTVLNKLQFAVIVKITFLKMTGKPSETVLRKKASHNYNTTYLYDNGIFV